MGIKENRKNFIRNAYILYKENFKTLKDIEIDLNKWNILLERNILRKI